MASRMLKCCVASAVLFPFKHIIWSEIEYKTLLISNAEPVPVTIWPITKATYVALFLKMIILIIMIIPAPDIQIFHVPGIQNISAPSNHLTLL